MFKRKKIQPVFKRNYWFTFKGISRIIIILLYYAASILIYYFILQTINFYQHDVSFSVEITTRNWPIVYFLWIGPFVSGVCDIIYRNTGALYLKAFVWCHTLLILIIIPIIIFI